MENSLLKKNSCRTRRAMRVRKKVRGTAERPRLSVTKTNAHIHVQLIDDQAGHTLASTSTLAKEFRSEKEMRRNKGAAQQLGKKIAALAGEKQIVSVVFDRGRAKYHGVVAALADAAREGGLAF